MDNNPNNLRGNISSPPSPARGVTGPYPSEVNYARASVANPATPQGQGEGDLWSQVVKGAQQSQQKYGIPASLTLAQFFQETGGGKHFVGNNLFGIKGASPDGGSIKALTWEQGPNGPYQTYSNFKQYKNVADSIEDHARLLAENPAYKKVQGLIQSGDNNPDDFADALQGVYATDPNYANALKSHLRTHDLVQYDFDNQTKTAKPAGPSPLGNVGSNQQSQYTASATMKPQQGGPQEASPTAQPQAPRQYAQDSWLNDQITQAMKNSPQQAMPQQQQPQLPPPPPPARPTQTPSMGVLPSAPQAAPTANSYQIPTPMIGQGTGSSSVTSQGGIPMPNIGGGTRSY